MKRLVYGLVLIVAALFLLSPGPAEAACCNCATSTGTRCRNSDCQSARNVLIQHHQQGEAAILTAMQDDFHLHREFIVREFFDRTVLPALMLMTEQMSNVAMMQMQIVGEFFDAKLHLETQRLFNELQNEANRDYYPSESFCWFGTNIRSFAASERLGVYNQSALNQVALKRQLGTVNGAAADSVDYDRLSRWKHFITANCDPKDNNHDGSPSSGLELACGTGATNPKRANRDIEYTRLMEEPRTLDVDFRNGTPTGDEEDVTAMAENLYGHIVPDRDIAFGATVSGQMLHLRERSIMAKRSVAQNTFSAIVGMKSAGTGASISPQFLFSILQDLGMSPQEIVDQVGNNPSYYAQLEAVGKRIFQNPDFFTDLYDKPANIDRKIAAMNALDLILDRAIYESELRHEMLYSVLLSSYLEGNKEAEFENFINATKIK